MSSSLPPIPSPSRPGAVSKGPAAGAAAAQAEAAEEEEGDDELMKLDVVSTLDPSMIRWINKRKGGKSEGGSNIKLTADKARQLRQIFNGLDYDGSGSVGIDEFQEAIAYVNAMQAKSGVPSSFGNRREINELFKAMDSDGNGEVDFGEFMDAMTGKLSKGMVGSDRDLHRLNTAFFEFARENRRRNLVDSIADKGVSDSVKGSNFVQLLSMDYMPAEMDDRKNTMDLKQLKKLLAQEQKELGAKFWNAKRREVTRSRHADMYFDMEEEARMKNSASSSEVFQPISVTSNTEPTELLSLPHNRDRYLRSTAKMKRGPSATFLPLCGEVDTGKGEARRHQMAVHAAKQVAIESKRTGLLRPPASVRETIASGSKKRGDR